MPAKEAGESTDEGGSSSHQDFDSYEAYCQANNGGEMKVRVLCRVGGRRKFDSEAMLPIVRPTEVP